MNPSTARLGWPCAALVVLCAPIAAMASQAVRVPAGERAALEALELAPSFRHTYGSFDWLVLEDADVERLERANVEFSRAGAGTIGFMDRRPFVHRRSPQEANQTVDFPVSAAICNVGAKT